RQWAQHSLLERTVSEAFAERYGVDPAEDLRPALLAGVMGSAVRAALRRWAGGGTDSLQHLIDTAFHLLDDGLLTDFSAPAGHTPQVVHGWRRTAPPPPRRRVCRSTGTSPSPSWSRARSSRSSTRRCSTPRCRPSWRTSASPPAQRSG